MSQIKRGHKRFGLVAVAASQCLRADAASRLAPPPGAAPAVAARTRLWAKNHCPCYTIPVGDRDHEVRPVRGFMAIAADRIYRLFASERNTRISQSLIGMLLAVTVMGAVMYALFDAARLVRPVARIERFLGIEVLRGGPATTSVTRPSDAAKSAER